MRGIGDRFEDRARRQLEASGLRLIARNFHTRFGELDLIMLDGAVLVFVEVRYRQHRGFGDATASVTARKRERLIRAANGFLAANPAYAERACRFDVVAYDGDAAHAAGQWRQAAFDAF